MNEQRGRRSSADRDRRGGDRDRRGGGRDDAPRERDDRPMRRSRPRAPRPNLPEGVRPTLPGEVRREVKQHVRGKELADEVGLCIMLAGDAIDADDPDGALPYVAWAKEVAPRAPVIREVLAVAHYLRGDFKAALHRAAGLPPPVGGQRPGPPAR